jgi:hypothetical protein
MNLAGYLREKWAALHAGQMIAAERQLLLLGRMLSETVKSNTPSFSTGSRIHRVFQFGDDGIIQWLVEPSGVSEQDLRRIRRGELPGIQYALSDDE